MGFHLQDLDELVEPAKSLMQNLHKHVELLTHGVRVELDNYIHYEKGEGGGWMYGPLFFKRETTIKNVFNEPYRTPLINALLEYEHGFIDTLLHNYQDRRQINAVQTDRTFVKKSEIKKYELPLAISLARDEMKLQKYTQLILDLAEQQIPIVVDQSIRTTNRALHKLYRFTRGSIPGETQLDTKHLLSWGLAMQVNCDKYTLGQMLLSYNSLIDDLYMPPTDAHNCSAIAAHPFDIEETGNSQTPQNQLRSEGNVILQKLKKIHLEKPIDN